MPEPLNLEAIKSTLTRYQQGNMPQLTWEETETTLLGAVPDLIAEVERLRETVAQERACREAQASNVKVYREANERLERNNRSLWQLYKLVTEGTMPRHFVMETHQCDVCGRKSWLDEDHELACMMTQPNGWRCMGMLRVMGPHKEPPYREGES